ncbi:MAG: AIR carboxylase family protein, partial [Selenomonas sp.]|nr:AIR carboxylase family protein [Selenomonas sp.]
MKVAVLMGSDSDWPILKPAVELLKHFGIEPVVKVASAHRTPSIVRDFVMEADHDKEFAAFIVAAGAAAHLAGVVASYTIK